MEIKYPVEIIGVSKVFDSADGEEITAVDNLSVDVHEGEVFGLLGANGAGKTTTLRMISTILHPTSGDILVDGYNTVTESDNVRRKLGFLSGDTGLYRKLTSRELIEYFGHLYGMDENKLKERVDELLHLLDMEEFENKRCESLSSGTKQKVNIARTIVHNPPILVFDEPTVGLDVMVARTLTDFILELKKLGKTVIFSTHIMREAERLCDRIAIIHKGKLLILGTLDEILKSTDSKDLEEAFFSITKDREVEG